MQDVLELLKELESIVKKMRKVVEDTSRSHYEFLVLVEQAKQILKDATLLFYRRGSE